MPLASDDFLVTIRCVGRPLKHSGINAWHSDGAATAGVLSTRASTASRTGAKQSSTQER